jgi:hypothetical protein
VVNFVKVLDVLDRDFTALAVKQRVFVERLVEVLNDLRKCSENKRVVVF